MVSARHPLRRTAAVLAAGVLTTAALLAPAGASPLDDPHDFESGPDGWFFYGGDATSEIEAGEFCTTVPAAHTDNPWDVAVPHHEVALEAMDYLLGRNALNNSYITGYGDVFSDDQHSRWFAHSIDPELPNPPRGSVAGGPNSDVGSWDPVISGNYDKERMCAPQLCYLDDIQSWSTNEITVNWNSALSWIASFVADQQAGDESGAGHVVDVVEHPGDLTVEEGEDPRFTASASGDPLRTCSGSGWSTTSGPTSPVPRRRP